MKNIRVFIIIFLILMLISNCAISPKYRSSGVNPSIYEENTLGTVNLEELKKEPSLQTVTGISSWYGPNFHGNLTANGEIFDMNKVSAAHRDFPTGTWLRVTNLKNNLKLIVRVNDRGPFVPEQPNRILDLSKKAAEELKFINEGLADVKIEVLRWGDNKYKRKKYLINYH
ncbi:septal ring lytic transglycosylase RlpA family protein [candidate division KSB1 bacterium]